jgi:hypothetical protein
MIFAALALVVASASPAHPLVHCPFTGDASHWVGGCGHIFDETPWFALSRAEKITTGEWRSDAAPQQVFSGKLFEKDDTDYPVELELYDHSSGIIRTEYGWHVVSHFKSSASKIDFDMDAVNEVPPNDLDLKIIERAASILNNPDVWNRADNRVCKIAAPTQSFYCAVAKASIEVTGGFDHRRPAAELVRSIVDERTKGRPYHHRLMDFNNDPTTTLADVQSIFSEAEKQIETHTAHLTY